MTIFFKSHQIVIRRQKSKGGFKYGWSATFTTYPADIQPSSDKRVDMINGHIGKVYDAWVDGSIDVKEGDQIVSSGITYAVRSVSYFQGAGLLDHKQLIIVAQD